MKFFIRDNQSDLLTIINRLVIHKISEYFMPNKSNKKLNNKFIYQIN